MFKKFSLFLVLLTISTLAPLNSFSANFFSGVHGGGFYFGPAAPGISHVYPNNGTAGTILYIYGQNLTGVTGVTVNGVSATNVSVTDGVVNATVPSNSDGTYDVVVTAPNGTSPTGASDQFTYQEFTQTYVAGILDPNGNLIDGTESRDSTFTTVPFGGVMPDGSTCAISTGCPIFLNFTGFWEDTSCISGQGPLSMALMNTIGGSTAWYQDNEFAGEASCGGGSFNVINGEARLWFNWDGSGNQISPPLEVVVVGGPQISTTGASFYSRNNTLGTWSSALKAGPNNSTFRAIADHEDDSGAKPVQFVMLGNDGDGMHTTTMNYTSPSNFSFNAITSNSENFCQNYTSPTTCNTPCSPNNITNCTNQQGFYPDQTPVTSASESGSHITLNWSSGNALIAPLSPNWSKVNLSGITGSTACTGLNGLQTVTSQTLTSATFASTVTGCTYTSAIVSTIANVVISWNTAITTPTGSITVSGITGCNGVSPNGTYTINNSTITAYTTYLQIALDSDCNGAGVSFSGATVSGSTPSSYNEAVTSVSSAVVGVQHGSPVRIVGITDCPVTSGGNNANLANFHGEGMNVWQRVDLGATNSFWHLKGVVPATGAGTGGAFQTGQPQVRGWTCIPTADSTNYPNGWELVGHIEGDGGVWAMNPDTGIFIREANLVTVLTSQWGWGSYGIDSYNSQGFSPITVGGKNYIMFSEGDAYGGTTNIPYELVPQKVTAFSGFWVRSTTSPASVSAPGFTVYPKTAQQTTILNQIAQHTAQPPAGNFGLGGFNACTSGGTGLCGLMVSTRTGPFVSEFYEDGGQRSAVTGGSGTTTMTINFNTIGGIVPGGFRIIGLTSSGSIGNANGFYICGVSATCTNSSVTITTNASATVTFTNAMIIWNSGQTLFYCGFDANATGVHSTSWCGRGPVAMWVWP